MLGRGSAPVTDITPVNNELYRRAPKTFSDHYHDTSSNIIAHTDDFPSSHYLLDRILEKRNASHQLMQLDGRDFYSHWNIMTTKWVQSISQRMY